MQKKKNCALKLVDEIILYYDARSKKHEIKGNMLPVTISYEQPTNAHIYY